MHERILVTTDGSEASMSAVEEAVDIASAYGATVHALYVVDTATRGGGLMDMDRPRPVGQLREIGEHATTKIESEGTKAGVEVTSAIREGIPYEAILEYVDEEDIDMIVMSSHGRSGVRRLIFGSVTERVVRATDLPVLVVQSLSAEDVESTTQSSESATQSE